MALVFKVSVLVLLVLQGYQVDAGVGKKGSKGESISGSEESTEEEIRIKVEERFECKNRQFCDGKVL